MRIVITEDATSFFKDPMVQGIVLNIDQHQLDFIVGLVSVQNNLDLVILKEELEE